MPAFSHLFDSTQLESTGTVQASDIEERLREITDQARSAIAEQRQLVVALGAVGAVLVVAIAYLSGRRRGKKRSTVLEIKRI